jgi:hypothetical protein
MSKSGLQSVLMMVYNNRNYWVFKLRPSSGILKGTLENTKFQEVDLFTFSSEPKTLLGVNSCKPGWKEIRNTGHIASTVFSVNVA